MSAGRSRAVQAIADASVAAAAAGDRHLQEEFGRLAVQLQHRDTTEAVLSGLMAAMAAATTTEETR